MPTGRKEQDFTVYWNLHLKSIDAEFADAGLGETDRASVSPVPEVMSPEAALSRSGPPLLICESDSSAPQSQENHFSTVGYGGLGPWSQHSGGQSRGIQT